MAMVAYAQETQHEKILRGLAVGIALVMYGRLEEADPLITSLMQDKDAILRRSGMYTIAMAYAGTGNKDALALIEPMKNDPVNYVRQGALIASAMILVQQTELTCSKVKDFRALYAKVISDKHEDVMAKFGAIVAQGIIDAGGRNVTVSLQSRTGHTSMLGVVGMLVFTQYWYWFPLTHFLSLAFQPTAVIGLNSNLDMPVVKFRSAAKPSTYGYPPALEEKKKEDKEKVTTAVLSITNKQKKKDAEKKKGKDGEEKMDVDEKKDDKKEKMDVDEKKDDDKKEDKKDEKEKEKDEPEPNFEMLSNPARVMKAQLKVVTLEDEKYMPMKNISIGGVIILDRAQLENDEKEEIVEPILVNKGGSSTDSEEEEPAPPEPFEYTED